MYTVSQKRDLYTFAHNFGRCSRISEIFQLLNSSRNLQQTDCHIAHHTLDVLLHYLVANFLTNSTMEKFRKSVYICQSYGQKYRGPFLTHSVGLCCFTFIVYLLYTGDYTLQLSCSRQYIVAVSKLCQRSASLQLYARYMLTNYSH